MTEFQPGPAAIGGALIGGSAVLLLWLNGRIAGISGILFGLFTRESVERNWRLMFVLGLVVGGFAYQWLTGQTLATRADFPLPLLALAGFLVGFHGYRHRNDGATTTLAGSDLMTRQLALPFSGFVAGIVFGVGLAVSQMTNPEKVLSFLDIFGHWDPSLLFTMGAAVAVSFIGYRVVLKGGPVLDEALHLPTRSDIDIRLLAGALIFGIGWGIAGYCPGPAIAGLTSGINEPLIFVSAMIVGGLAEGVRANHALAQ